jgi:flavin-dependent thymidylate synthase
MAEHNCPSCGSPPYAVHSVDCLYREPTWLDKRRAEQDIRVMPKFSREYHDNDDSRLVADVAFNRHTMNDGEHVSPTDNNTIQVGRDGIRVALAQGIDEDALKKTLSAAVRATVGLDMTQGDALEAHGDWEEMLKGGLQTALETQTIVFAVSGVSRTCTHQLVRSRRASFHQQSQRASYMGDGPECRMPESVWQNTLARSAFLGAVMESWKAYRTICEQDISYQDARFVLPEGTTNFILLEYPIREFLNVYAYRACSMFQWEIVEVMRKCREVLVEAHPFMEPYVKISCEKTGPAVITQRIPLRGDVEQASHETVAHHCTFQGWEDVEGQCDFAWAKHEARTFKPEFHRITREHKPL